MHVKVSARNMLISYHFEFKMKNTLYVPYTNTKIAQELMDFSPFMKPQSLYMYLQIKGFE